MCMFTISLNGVDAIQGVSLSPYCYNSYIINIINIYNIYNIYTNTRLTSALEVAAAKPNTRAVYTYVGYGEYVCQYDGLV